MTIIPTAIVFKVTGPQEAIEAFRVWADEEKGYADIAYEVRSYGVNGDNEYETLVCSVIAYNAPGDGFPRATLENIIAHNPGASLIGAIALPSGIPLMFETSQKRDGKNGLRRLCTLGFDEALTDRPAMHG
jgi:hypothetical protein